MTTTEEQHEAAEMAAAFARAELESTFGPTFFLHQLKRFVRDRCPDPAEHLPAVQVRVAGGEVLDVCHVIGISPRWVVLAVREPGSQPEGMVVEIVPFQLIHGVRIQAKHAGGGRSGFVQVHAPQLIAAETLMTSALGIDARAENPSASREDASWEDARHDEESS
jgi:hypothetical protein